jgi:hypothetical protein
LILAAIRLAENLLPSWACHAPDVVTQARVIWTLAAAHRHGVRDRGYLDLARHGIDFLTERMGSSWPYNFSARRTCWVGRVSA